MLTLLEPEDEAGGSEYFRVVSKVADYVATLGDDVVLGDATAGSFNVSLPASVAVGKMIVVIKVDDSANAIGILPWGGDVIEADSSLSLASQFDKAWLLSNGNGVWLNLGKGAV